MKGYYRGGSWLRNKLNIVAEIICLSNSIIKKGSNLLGKVTRRFITPKSPMGVKSGGVFPTPNWSNNAGECDRHNTMIQQLVFKISTASFSGF